jgi:GT2 family glycosyltransferase
MKIVTRNTTVGIITITWNRLWYTYHCLKILEKKAGYPYKHIIIDNGSQDGTYEFLKEEGYNVIRNEINMGIVHAFYQGKKALGNDTEIIIKIDNDCEIVTDNLIYELVKFSKKNQRYIVSPVINGLNNRVQTVKEEKISGLTFLQKKMIGGIFFPHPNIDFIPQETNNAKKLDDCVISPYYQEKGYKIGYIKEWQANHFETTNGQIERYGDKSNYKF